MHKENFSEWILVQCYLWYKLFLFVHIFALLSKHLHNLYCMHVLIDVCILFALVDILSSRYICIIHMYVHVVHEITFMIGIYDNNNFNQLLIYNFRC